MKTENYKKAVQNIFQRVGQTVTKDIPTLDYIMNVDAMSDTDKIFYEAYKKYGNRNHTWQDFKEMFHGDVATMQKTVKNWRTWDEINTQAAQTEAYAIKVQKLLQKYNLDSINDTNMKKYKQDYPDLVDAFMDWLTHIRRTHPNYSTFDPQVAKLEMDFEKQVKSIAPDDKNGKINLVTDYLKQMDELVDLRNGDFVVGERIEMYRKIISKNKQISEQLHNFDNLSGSEKVNLARMILDESAQENGLPRGTIIEDDAPNGPHKLTDAQGAAYDRRRRAFIFKGSGANFSNANRFLKTLAHEDAHRVDFYNPEYGMIGTQLMLFVTDNYMNNAAIANELYEKWATEQSSYYLDKTTGAALQYAISHQKI